MENLIPKGYRSIQDFMLHYHQNNSVSCHTDYPNAPEEVIPNTENPPRLVGQKIIESEGSRRNYYESASKSSIHPDDLPDPSDF
ncbi:hypothetical protein TVAG_300770 [Trichomonas vaginalis G3]|uniref:Uncharacterized protein n=1 Tax=Trichomonas vaginalis (strain ATCC PRA-98 / G3) TaxID=412133 RepID=A2FKK8_TRIV3|nr:hypothetical protein TVAGG3_0270940 [Trichomonas vaginalis G3]EAX94544.1 hypothetical protein TVAG_300770 [Trichomonas vaginalis G3]KAI5525858.1 hypothetical protein TVAGG3_0270940 [Trichomonas vaginalis G3]|eukprot:XP_001307474.1 hypothetical protein [Trichomonas vaginalis G3]